MNKRERWPDFFRLTKGLRAMKFNFRSGPSKRKMVTVILPSTGQPSQVQAKDKNGTPLYEETPEQILADDVELEESNLVTSRHRFGRDKNGGKGMHRIVLDIDMDAALIPSTTPGHFHLIIDKVLDWPDYEKLLIALREAGVIQRGYANASISKGYTAIRPPWEKKRGGLVGNFQLTTKTSWGINSTEGSAPVSMKTYKAPFSMDMLPDEAVKMIKMSDEEFAEWKTEQHSKKPGASSLTGGAKGLSTKMDVEE